MAIEQAAENFDAFGADVVWSGLDADGRYRLRHYDGARVRTLPISGRSVPFDVDLGPNGRAVYARCRREATDVAPFAVGRGCAIHRLDLRTGRARRLRQLSARRGEEVLPAIWGKRIAFARATGAGPRRRWRVLVTDTSGRRPRDVTGPQPRRPTQVPGPTAVELIAGHVWFLWLSRVSGDACPTAAETPGDAMRTALRLAPPLRPSRLVDAACDVQRLEALYPGLTGDARAVTVLGALSHGGGTVVRRYSGAAAEEAALPREAVVGAVAGTVPYFVRFRDRRLPVEIVQGDPVAFAPAERQVP